MTFLGTANSVNKPVVKLNGISVTSVNSHAEVGGIPTCQVGVRPEDLTDFIGTDIQATLTVDGVNIFFGYVVGVGYSNMNGGLVPSVSLIHVARDLDEITSSLPGVSPGSTADVTSLLYTTDSSAVASASSGLSKFFVSDWTQPFSSIICTGLGNVISKSSAQSVSGYAPVVSGTDKQTAINILNQISGWSNTGVFVFGSNAGIASGASRYIDGCLQRAGTSSSLWDVLSGIIAAFDCALVCKPGGNVCIMPNFVGVAAQENQIPTSFIQKVDRSALTTRSPKDCIVVAPTAIGTTTSNYTNQFSPIKLGSYSSTLPGSKGSMLLAAPGWMSMLNGSDFPDSTTSPITAYAQTHVLSYSNRQKTFNIVTPVAPGAFPGVCATFSPFSGAKSFDGGPMSAFGATIDGYCKSVDHVLSGGTFSTIFRFECALEQGVYEKQKSHPFFPKATMDKWD